MFAAMACGTAGIRIAWPSRLCMALVSSGFIILSAIGKSILLADLPVTTIRIIGFVSLTLIGLMQIFGDAICSILMRTRICALAPLRIGARVFRDHTLADMDQSKTLSIPEAFVLAIPVSIDSLIGGLGVMACGLQLIPLFVIALVWNFFAVWYGRWFGTKIPIPNERFRSVICGLGLIVLGVCKLL